MNETVHQSVHDIQDDIMEMTIPDGLDPRHFHHEMNPRMRKVRNIRDLAVTKVETSSHCIPG